MSWQELISDPEFQQQPYDVKKRVAENYFKRNMIDDEFTKQSSDIQMKAFNNFLLTIGAPDSQLPQGGTLQGDGLVQQLLKEQQGKTNQFAEQLSASGYDPTGKREEIYIPPGDAYIKENKLSKFKTVSDKYINKPASQFLYGYTSEASGGILPAILPKELKKQWQPQNIGEEVARGTGSLVGFIQGWPLKAAKKVTKKLLPKASPKLTQTVELAFANFFQSGNEEIPDLITSPSSKEFIDFAETKIKSAIVGGITGFRYGQAGQLPKYWERAAANLIIGNIINAAHSQLETGKLPQVQDIVYNSLMDLYFSKGRVPTKKEIEFIKNASKQVSDGLLENTVQWNKLIKDAEKYPNKDFSKDLRNAYVQWHYGNELQAEVTKLNMASLSEAEQLAKVKTVQKPKAKTEEPAKPEATPEPVKAPEIVEPVQPEIAKVETPVVETKPTPVVKTKKKVKQQEPIITPEPVVEPTKEEVKTEIEIKSPELEKKEAQPESNYEEINGISIIKPKEVPLKAGDTHTYLNKDGTRTPVKIVGVFNLKDRIGEIKGKTYYSRLVKEVIGNLSDNTKIIEIDGDIPSNGWYSRENGNIFINRKNATSNLKLQSTLAHEIVHAVTVSPFEKSRLGQTLTDKEVKFRNDMLSLVNEIFPKLSEEWQGNFKKNYKSDPDTYAKEFLGYGFTNEKFIKELNKIKVEGSKSAFSKLMDLVKQFFNISESSALEKLIKTTSEYIETPKAATQKVEAPKPVKPKRSVGKGKATTKVETPTEAVAEIVEGKRQSNIGTAEFKTKMLAELDKAIEKAPSHGMTEADFAKYKKGKLSIAKQEFDKITIEIPGDGKFNIVNVREELQRVKDKVKALPLSDKTKIPKAPESITGKTRWEVEGEYLKKQELKKEEGEIPLYIKTRIEKFRELGYTDEQLKNLPPDKAGEILRNRTRADVKPPPAKPEQVKVEPNTKQVISKKLELKKRQEDLTARAEISQDKDTLDTLQSVFKTFYEVSDNDKTSLKNWEMSLDNIEKNLSDKFPLSKPKPATKAKEPELTKPEVKAKTVKGEKEVSEKEYIINKLNEYVDYWIKQVKANKPNAKARLKEVTKDRDNYLSGKLTKEQQKYIDRYKAEYADDIRTGKLEVQPKPEVKTEAKPENVVKPQTIEFYDKNQKTRTGKLVETKKNDDVLVEMADGTQVTVKADNVKQPKKVINIDTDQEIPLDNRRKKEVERLSNKLKSYSDKVGDKEFVGYVKSRGFNIESLTERQANLLLHDLKRGIKFNDVATQEGYDALRDLKEKTDLPKYARSVNIKKQDIPENYKQFEHEVAKLKPRKKQTWDETGRLSKEITKDYEKGARVLNKAKKKQALTAVEIDAGRQINVNAIDRLKEIAETGTSEQFESSFKNYVQDVFMPLSDASSEAGRALNIHKKMVSTNRIANAFAKLKRSLNVRELAEFKTLNFENPLEVKRFIDRLGDPSLKDYVYEYWYNSILSGIPTHLVNVTSNTAWSLFQLPHRALVGSIDALVSKFKGRTRQIYASEIIPMLAGYKTGFLKGKNRALELIRTNKVIAFEDKWSMDVGHGISSAFERSPYAALRKIAPLISAPTRALRAMDVWANSIAFDGQLNALANRAAKQKGLKGIQKEKFIKDFMENPSDEVLAECQQYAKYNTFTDDPDKITQWIIQGRNILPGEVGRFVIPFVNTISNITKRGLEMTPGVGLVKEIVSRKMGRGQPLKEVIAKQIEGAVLGLWVLYKVSDEEITGAVPESKTAREAFYRQGKQAWSIKIGDKWYQYRRIEPFNTVIASVALAHDKIKNAKDDETATQIFGNVVDGLLQNFIDSSYLQGLTNILDKYSGRKGMVQRQLASFVPYSGFWRSINKAIEKAETGKVTLKETKTFEGAFRQVIPGLTRNTPGKLNIWGQEIEIEGGVFRQWLPYKWSTETTDPLENELERLNIMPGLPGQSVKINGEQTKFNDEFYRNYVITFGAIAKKELDKYIKTDRYKNLKTDEAKTKALDRKLTSIREEQLKKAKERYTGKKESNVIEWK